MPIINKSGASQNHFHENLLILSKLGESEGRLTFNGTIVGLSVTTPQANQANWVATASVGSSPQSAVDSDSNSRFTTGTGKAPGQTWQVDFLGAIAFNAIRIADTNTDNGSGHVEVSNDGSTWQRIKTDIALVGDIAFAQQNARHLRLINTASSSSWWWSIKDLQVLLI